MSIALAAQLVAIGFTLASIYLTGRKSLWGPAIGAAGVVPWTAFCLLIGAYPMVGLNVVVTGLHIQTLMRWRREA